MRIDLPQMDLPRGERGATGAWLEDNVATILEDEFFGWQETSHVKYFQNGTTWQYAPLKYWDGSDWKTRYLKRWNGSEWVIEKG